MKCFVTGRSSNIDEVNRAYTLLQAAGHEVFRWTHLPSVKPYQEHSQAAAQFAADRITEISESDVYILLAHHDGNGVFPELGAALAVWQLHGKLKIYGVSRDIPDAIFHYHPAIVWRETIEEVVSDLETTHL
jgi:hypothetical protein